MSSPSFSPTPNDPSHEALFSAEFEAHIDLLVQLHRFHEHGTTADDIMEGLVIDLNEPPHGPSESKLYSWIRSSEALEDYLYDEMVFKPRPGTETAVWADEIFVRFPRLKDKSAEEGEEKEVIFAPFADPSGIVTPKDILIEVNGERYLLNDHGIFPYPDGEALVLSTEELLDPKRSPADKPNVYSVPEEFQLAAPYRSAVMLDKMLLKDSKYSQREDR